ncbi:MAG: DNA gyrase C-terminal beta-propeller domain-containing protein, partial [Roseovarius sp.]
LDFRREVLIRRSQHRMEKIDHRLEVLEGLIVAFLNLDRVIDIIRYDDEPKAALMREDWGREFTRANSEADYVPPAPGGDEDGLTDVQAEAILNMRLRSLRRLEEMELLKERDVLMEERAGLEDLLESESLQWEAIAGQLKEVKKTFGKDYEGGARRTLIEEAGEVEEVPLEAMIDREPITVVCSKMGWVRAMTGHIDLTRELKFKDGDGPRFIFHAETTDKLLIFGSNGRFYTLAAANLPGGRGMGEPLRLMVDLPNESEIVTFFIHRPGARLLVASSAGDGFIVPEDEVVAQTRSGKQVLNVRGDVRAQVCKPVAGDHVACVGENRKVLVFPLDELPEMGRGKGVRLQRYKDGGLSDATTFTLADGLSWHDPAGRTRTETDLAEWIGKRAGTGRMAPRGFPRDNRFT